MLRDVTTCLETVGQVNPLNKVYKLVKDLDYFPLAALLLTQNALSQLTYDQYVFNLTRSRKDLLIDGPHFIIGLCTIFKQFHYSHYKKYVHYLIHFVKVALSASKDIQLQKRQIDNDAITTMTFLEELIKFDGTSREIVTQNIGSFIFDYYKPPATAGMITNQ
ncbi:hypothetical protein FGO68_gene3106 [Halteria grandinella]|uniref:Uncharacterized protein n=1 Tax=Halteria grandinella TaxID=5974 RepID=A0A8J8NC65_HALGN|nr:hypothetical protein FGO68_gene3106 [Halteria grandinella]